MRNSELTPRGRPLPHSPFRIPNWNRGFTLLESLLALVLFAGGTIAGMELLQRSQVATADGENILLATALAQRRHEELHNVAFGSLADEAKAPVSSPTGYPRFSRQVTVTTPSTNLRLVVVTVFWTAPGGETSVRLQTYRSNS